MFYSTKQQWKDILHKIVMLNSVCTHTHIQYIQDNEIAQRQNASFEGEFSLKFVVALPVG